MRRPEIVAAFLALFFSLALAPQAESADCRPVAIGNPDGNYIVPGSWGEIVYQTADGVDLVLDAYVQRGTELRPGVLVVHGGGWTSGSRVSFVGQFLEILTAAGFNWFSIDYRKGPQDPYPAALEDLRAALAFVRCNAQHFRLDPDRIVLLGEDSGAHLAAMLAAERPEGVRGLVTFGAPFDLTALASLKTDQVLRRYFELEDVAGRTLPDAGCPPGMAHAECNLRLASPFHQVDENLPAVLAVHGAADSEVASEQSQRYCSAVREQGGECDLLLVEGAIHRPENWTPAQWHYKPHLVAWLYRTLDVEPLAHQPYAHDNLHKDIVYNPAASGDAARPDLKLDAWIPDGPGPFPVVILVHGGGWEAGDKVTYLTPLFEPLARAGFAWFSIDYRLTPDHSHAEQLEDLRRAIRFVRHEATRFKIDPDRIALLGESASGQMAVLLGASECPGREEAVDPIEREPCRVQATVSFYGVYDFLPMVRNASPRSLLHRLFGINVLDDHARKRLKDYSPLYRVRAQMPPLLLIHGTNETLWEDAVNLKERLQALGADFELIALQGAPHGMENWEGHPNWESYKPRLIEWLNRKLRSE